jgi:hypothetical protein
MNYRGIFFFFAILMAFISAVEGQQPRILYGKILLDLNSPNIINNIAVSYSYFKIEIVEIAAENAGPVNPGKVLYTTYPDNRGYFTFKDVPENRYRIQISLKAVRNGQLVDEKIYENQLDVRYDQRGKHRMATILIDVIVSQLDSAPDH